MSITQGCAFALKQQGEIISRQNGVQLVVIVWKQLLVKEIWKSQ